MTLFLAQLPFSRFQLQLTARGPASLDETVLLRYPEIKVLRATDFTATASAVSDFPPERT
jgi:hypothetical protein